MFEHQIIHILNRDDYTLPAGEPPGPAEVKKPLHLFGHPADGLYFTLLVHWPGHRQTLVNRQTGKAGEQAVQLGAGGAVSIHPVVQLLKGNPGRKA